MAAFDFKKEYKDLYLPRTAPMLIDVPAMVFLCVDGAGDPNTCAAYQEALELLYGLSYSIKMSKMDGTQPEGYFDYVVPPLEGFWSVDDDAFDGRNVTDKSRFKWTAMIRQPEFVTPRVLDQARAVLHRKKPELDLPRARLETVTEGLCAQVMHVGPYDDEPAALDRLDRFIREAGYRLDLSDSRRHHEIYLGDPRRTAPEKLRTVLRHPIAPL